MKTFLWVLMTGVLVWLLAGPALGLTILVAPSFSTSTDIAPRLTALGHTVLESDPLTWDHLFDYSVYDVVAFQHTGNIPADVAHLVDAVDAGDIGVVFFRGSGSDATATALGLIASPGLNYQSANPLSVIDNNHPITHNLEITTYSLGYGNMSYVVDPGVDTTTLGTGADGAALVVHNTRRAVVTPYYGAYWESDTESEVGYGLTERSLQWAAGVPVSVRKMTMGKVKMLFAD